MSPEGTRSVRREANFIPYTLFGALDRGKKDVEGLNVSPEGVQSVRREANFIPYTLFLPIKHHRRVPSCETPLAHHHLLQDETTTNP